MNYSSVAGFQEFKHFFNTRAFSPSRKFRNAGNSYRKRLGKLFRKIGPEKRARQPFLQSMFDELGGLGDRNLQSVLNNISNGGSSEPDYWKVLYWLNLQEPTLVDLSELNADLLVEGKTIEDALTASKQSSLSFALKPTSELSKILQLELAYFLKPTFSVGNEPSGAYFSIFRVREQLCRFAEHFRHESYKSVRKQRLMLLVTSIRSATAEIGYDQYSEDFRQIARGFGLVVEKFEPSEAWNHRIKAVLQERLPRTVPIFLGLIYHYDLDNISKLSKKIGVPALQSDGGFKI